MAKFHESDKKPHQQHQQHQQRRTQDRRIEIVSATPMSGPIGGVPSMADESRPKPVPAKRRTREPAPRPEITTPHRTPEPRARLDVPSSSRRAPMPMPSELDEGNVESLLRKLYLRMRVDVYSTKYHTYISPKRCCVTCL